MASNPQAVATAELELRRRKAEGGGIDAYAAFQHKYFYDLEGFARECVSWDAGDGLTEYQAEGMRRLVKHKRFSMRGPHGLGKTAFAALVILWFALTRDGKDWKVPALASAWRQLTKFLFPEVHKWAGKLRWDVIGREPLNPRELLTLSVKLETGEAFAIASDNPAYIEGAHADHILYVFDESKVIPDGTWDAAEGAFSTGECYWLAISTPGDQAGRFYEIHARKPGYEDWSVLFVTLEMAIAAGRISREWADNRRRQWGASSAVFRNRVLGEFAGSAADGVINLADLERSNQRWLARYEGNGFKALTGLGVDIGRGGDPSCLAREYDGSAVKEFDHLETDNSMEIAGRVVGILQLWQAAQAVIDLGYDPGVYDRVREDEKAGDRAIAFVSSAKTELKDETGELGFVNLRAAAWWNLRELLKNDLYDLPPDDRLTGDLTAPRWKVMSGGRVAVEGKDETQGFGKGLRARLGRSTDYGDSAVMVAFRKNMAGTEQDDQYFGAGNVRGYKSRWE